ncbi:MAG: hypothetical protein M3P96_09680, partial [Actinomycetota bacterium]|nr:hypothetical protein [Actinomycetota bacterium]
PLALSSALTVGGIGAAGAAVQVDRRGCGWLAVALPTAAGWVRLLAAEIALVEAYTVAPALVLLAVGFLRRRRDLGASSWHAYGSALALGLLPSLVVALSDGAQAPLRPLLLLAAALAVTLVGAARRLHAPLVVGGAVLAVDAVAQLAPYAAALPRWLARGGRAAPARPGQHVRAPAAAGPGAGAAGPRLGLSSGATNTKSSQIMT